MRTFYVAAFVMVALCSPVYPQAVASEKSTSVKVENNKPTVYLTVERKDKVKVSFRLHNNTNWAISVLTISYYYSRKRTAPLGSGGSVFTLPDDVEIDSLHYYVEKEPRTPSHVKAPELGYPDSSSISWIAAKGSILFSVPIKQLEAGLMIYVPFHYEWELNRQLIFNNEPDHRVYFRGVDLSQDAAAVLQRQ
jgi:hypothetical protein